MTFFMGSELCAEAVICIFQDFYFVHECLDATLLLLLGRCAGVELILLKLDSPDET